MFSGLQAMGGTRIIYTAKHSCGFLAWRTKTDYNYSAGYTQDGETVPCAHTANDAHASQGD